MIDRLVIKPLSISEQFDNELARMWITLNISTELQVCLFFTLSKTEIGYSIEFPSIYEDSGVPNSRLKKLETVMLSDKLYTDVVEAGRKSWEFLEKTYSELDYNLQYVIMAGGKVYTYPQTVQLDLFRRVSNASATKDTSK